MDFICVLCGGTVADQEVSAGEFVLQRCRQCGLMGLWPQPTPTQLAKAYDRPYYTRHRAMWWQRLYMRFFRRWGRARLKALKSLKSRGRFLDVGCGTGELVADMAAAGYEVYGSEVSTAAIEAMPPERQARVKSGEIYQCGFAPASFDLIMLSDVLEHTRDPLATLKTVRQLLRPDGLVVISVPNWHDVERRVFGRQCWHNLDVPRHIWQFTEKTLREVARQAGLTAASPFRFGWITHFEAPLSLVGGWHCYLRSSGLSAGWSWWVVAITAPIMLGLTLLLRLLSRQPRQLRFVFKPIGNAPNLV